MSNDGTFACTEDDMFSLSLRGLELECELCHEQEAVIQLYGVCVCQACYDRKQAEWTEEKPIDFDERLASAVEGRDYGD